MVIAGLAVGIVGVALEIVLGAAALHGLRSIFRPRRPFARRRPRRRRPRARAPSRVLLVIGEELARPAGRRRKEHAATEHDRGDQHPRGCRRGRRRPPPWPVRSPRARSARCSPAGRRRRPGPGAVLEPAEGYVRAAPPRPPALLVAGGVEMSGRSGRAPGRGRGASTARRVRRLTAASPRSPSRLGGGGAARPGQAGPAPGGIRAPATVLSAITGDGLLGEVGARNRHRVIGRRRGKDDPRASGREQSATTAAQRASAAQLTRRTVLASIWLDMMPEWCHTGAMQLDRHLERLPRSARAGGRRREGGAGRRAGRVAGRLGATDAARRGSSRRRDPAGPHGFSGAAAARRRA